MTSCVIRHQKRLFAASASLIAILLALGCQPAPDDPSTGPVAALKDVFADVFRVGAAVNRDQAMGRDTLSGRLVATHFNTITAENDLKWERVHPEPDLYDFAGAEEFVRFGEEHGLFIVGHVLVWHSQTPKWVFEDESGNRLGRDALLERMRGHIQTVVGRYKGRIHGWDVVNEALNEDGTLRKTPWLEIIGEDYIEQAFRFAHEADPDAELYYNDYSLPNPAKRDGAIALIRDLQSKGVPVHGLGMQGHYKMDWPAPELVDEALTAFAGLGIPVHFTELDIDVLPASTSDRGADVGQTAEMRPELNPYAGGLTDSAAQALTDRYRGLFEVLYRHRDTVDRVTFWGVTDASSWLNNWPVRGRTNYPLLFDRDGNPKPAFYAVIAVARP